MKRQTIDIPKHPEETIGYEMDFSTALASGDSLSGGLGYVYDRSTNADMSATMISGSVTATGNVISMFVKGGANGKSYDLKYVVTTGGGETLVEILVMSVKS